MITFERYLSQAVSSSPAHRATRASSASSHYITCSLPDTREMSSQQTAQVKKCSAYRRSAMWQKCPTASLTSCSFVRQPPPTCNSSKTQHSGASKPHSSPRLATAKPERKDEWPKPNWLRPLTDSEYCSQVQTAKVWSQPLRRFVPRSLLRTLPRVALVSHRSQETSCRVSLTSHGQQE